MKNIKAVIFDIDDTLYPQIEYTRQCLLNTADYIAELSGQETEIIKSKLSEILEKNGIEYRFIYNDLFTAINFDGMPNLKNILGKFWECNPQITLYNKTSDVLSELKKKYRLAILSDGHVDVQNYKIKALGISDFFENILITDSIGVENRKPSPVPYQKLLCDMGLDGYDCVYVGNDPNKDFIACKDLKIKTIRIRQGDYKNLTLDPKYEADFEVNGIEEILNLIY